MDPVNFSERVKDLLKTELPRGEKVVSEGIDLGRSLKPGRSAFMNAYGVNSEAEYKRQCIRDRKIMYHCHIGMSSWNETARGLKYLHRSLASEGFYQDRAGICLDRRMALPPAMRRNAPAETGPLLENLEEWLAVGQAAPIQPHMGDFMIGFPASADNTVLALRAGVTTIGNLSQFFSHEAPGWRDTPFTAGETVKAIALMGALREQGTLVHSYLDDGLGALFTDCATVAGWAFLERYIVEELMGAKLAHCVGGLVSDPVKRSGWIFALQEIHQGDCVGSMFYGDTISFTRDFSWNRGVVAETLLWDILTQMECPTGHAVLSIPVTEAVRVPNAEEILEAQIFARNMEGVARRVHPSFDFSAPRAFAEKVVSAGRTVFNNALDGLSDAGVDLKDPVQMLFVLKSLGPKLFEETFGAGTPNPLSLRGRDAVVPNDVFEHSLRSVDKFRDSFASPDARSSLEGRRIVLASTDVHEHALFVIEQLLEISGVRVVNVGPERNPDEIAHAVGAENADAVLVSTHNGMALDYANAMLEEMEERNLSVPVFMGGVLNQKVEENEMPIDVEESLQGLGIRTCSNPMDLLENLVVMWKNGTDEAE
jgi:methylmalonyl-CoA mutase cobalamin-binding subunit